MKNAVKMSCFRTFFKLKVEYYFLQRAVQIGFLINFRSIKIFENNLLPDALSHP